MTAGAGSRSGHDAGGRMRRGVGLAMPLVAVLVTVLVPVSLARHRHGMQALSAAARSARGGVLLDLGRSALAEGWWRMEQALTDPDGVVFHELRRAGRSPLACVVTPTFLLERLRADPALAGYALEGARVDAHVAALMPVGEDPCEGTATVELVVTVSHASERVARRLRERREMRVARLALPPPFDRYALVVLDRGLGVPAASVAGRAVTRDHLTELSGPDASELAAGAARLDLAQWRRRALFRFEGPGAVRRFLALLDERAAEGRPVSATVLVDDPTEPLRLRRRTIHGRLVVATTAGAELVDVRLRDPAADLLVVQAARRVEVGGRVDAAVIAQDGVEVNPGARLAGALVLFRAPASRDVAGELRADVTRFSASERSLAAVLAPWALEREVEAL